MRRLSNTIGPSHLFRMPNIVGRIFAPGPQPYSPGESHITDGNPHFRTIPWPNAVDTLRTLSSNPGIPRAPALQMDNNQTAVLPSNYLFLAGVASKSRG